MNMAKQDYLRHIISCSLVCATVLTLGAGAATAQTDATPAAPTTWSAPTVLYPESWPAPRYVSFSNDGTRLVALVPNSGGDDNSRHIIFSEAKNGVWQPPVVVAQNGAYSEAAFQPLPQRTHPIISGDDKTIAYPPAPPPGEIGIGGIGGIGGLGGSFLTTLLGPGGLPIQPTRPVTITVDYSNTDSGTTIPGSLSLWWRNADTWVQLPSVDDPAIRQVMAPVSHFSHFAVFGETNRLYLPHVTR